MPFVTVCMPFNVNSPQADQASEGVRALTQSTYKRVDEHAAAIQRLTLVGALKGRLGLGRW